MIKIEASKRLAAFRQMPDTHPILKAIENLLVKKHIKYQIIRPNLKGPSPGGVVSYILSAAGDWLQTEAFDKALLQVVKSAAKGKVTVKPGKGSVPPMITAGDVLIAAHTTDAGVDIQIGLLP